MSAVHGKGSRIVVNNLHVSGQLNTWSAQHSRQYGDATTFLSSGDQWRPGLASGLISLGGLLDSSVALEDELATQAGTDNSVQVLIAPEGWTLGALAICAVTDPGSMIVSASVKEMIALSADLKPDGLFDLGSLLAIHAQVSTDASGTAVNDGAATTTGGVAYLHCTEFTGLTSIAVTVQDSADGATGWATIATFATLTAVGHSSQTIAGTIRQYVRAVWDVTGTGTATFAVALGRR